ncbi:hypothetical protein L7F22_018703 [Adiantum nelumboides]|nr:hypothetical protein [Adiantum nelumboides]
MAESGEQLNLGWLGRHGRRQPLDDDSHGLQDSPQYQRAVEHSRRIDFTRTHEGADQEGEPRVGVVSIFETTIRYIGGLLSAYQLGGERAQDRFMVQQMQTLADGLSFGWDKGHRIPFNYVQINTTPPRPDDSSDTANLAEAGSLLLEWHSLSQYSQNSTYGALAMQSMRAIMESKGAFPGLFPQNIWPGNESYKDDYHTYGVSGQVPVPDRRGAGQRLLQALRTEHGFRPEAPRLQEWSQRLVFLTDYSEKVANGTINIFFPLGLLRRRQHGHGRPPPEARRLDNAGSAACRVMCARTARHVAQGCALGLGLVRRRQAGQRVDVCQHAPRRLHYNKEGFFVTNTDWVNRPEILESCFMLTGSRASNSGGTMPGPFFSSGSSTAILARAGRASSMSTTTRGCSLTSQPSPYPWLTISSYSTGLYDSQQTFLFAETFKYLYLIFDDPDAFSLDEYGEPVCAALPLLQVGKTVNTSAQVSTQSGSPASFPLFIDKASDRAASGASGATAAQGQPQQLTMGGGMSGSAHTLKEFLPPSMPLSAAKACFSGIPQHLDVVGH